MFVLSFQAKREVLKKRPVSLVQLKQLLQIMTELKGGLKELVDEHVTELKERYRLIEEYGDDEFKSHVTEANWRSPVTLRRRWNAIIKRSIDMADDIAPMKAQFGIGVVGVVKEFKIRILEFVER